jgi:pimeloyl-ACP methyl ester carboxylesterase
LHAYDYLFADASAPADNPFDPQFRGACDLYNQSLEGALRIVRGQGEFHPGDKRTIKTASHLCQFDVQLFSTGWHPDDFDRFEFVSDYQVNGLRNHYHTYGLGVPLIAIRRQHESEVAAEEYYPPSLAFPITAFLRVDKSPRGYDASGAQDASHNAPRLVLELHDTLDRQQLAVNNRLVPLESDLSTPLAYFLNQPHFQDSKLSTEGLLRPDAGKRLQGLYMLEPYDPRKMPVVMVHGLWSSPVTWMEMYNDLRSDPQVREHYQFWFYLYPTGQPFWTSAAQMRSALASLRATVDPRREHYAIDQMVLVGHSMGGLVSKLQTVDSGEAFWSQVSERSLAELDAPDETKQTLAATYYFAPNPSVRNVITIGTPHRGSPFSNDVTRWLGNKLITVPMNMMQMSQQLLDRNGDALRPNSPLLVRTSIDSLAPDSPLLPVLLSADSGPWVEYHNIVGRVPHAGIRGYFAGDGDGIVNFDSAHLDETANLRSQVIVPADHVSIHRHPQSILEVRRILMEQVRELKNFGNTDVRVAGASVSQ